MEVAILRACAFVLCEGDFGLAGVVIGYTYKCRFLPLPHVRLQSLSLPPPLFLPPWSPSFPHCSPRTWLHFRHKWGVKREGEQWNEEVRERQMIDLKNREGRKQLWMKNKSVHACTYISIWPLQAKTHTYIYTYISFTRQGSKAKRRKNTRYVTQTVNLFCWDARRDTHIQCNGHLISSDEWHFLPLSLFSCLYFYNPPLWW